MIVGAEHSALLYKKINEKQDTFEIEEEKSSESKSSESNSQSSEKSYGSDDLFKDDQTPQIIDEDSVHSGEDCDHEIVKKVHLSCEKSSKVHHHHVKK